MINLKTQKIFFNKKTPNSLERKVHLVKREDFISKQISFNDFRKNKSSSPKQNKSVNSIKNGGESKFEVLKEKIKNKKQLQNKALKFLPENVITKILENPYNKEDGSPKYEGKNIFLKKENLFKNKIYEIDLKKNHLFREKNNNYFQIKDNNFPNKTSRERSPVNEESQNDEILIIEKKLSNFFLNKRKNSIGLVINY